jgi:biopolymer transport protein TolR
MALIQGSKDKKDLNVELNLLPVFDVLSVCICFLLMTVVWVEVRSLETKQALGSQSEAESVKGASLSLMIDEQNNLKVVLKNASGAETKKLAPAKKGMIDFQYAENIYSFAASQNVKTMQILPSKNTQYDQIIHMMDLAKKAGIINIGLSPI